MQGHIPALKMAQYGIIGRDFILSSCLKSSMPLMEGRNAGLLSLAHISMQYVFSKQSADLCELHSNGNDLVLRYPVSFSKFMQRPIRQIRPISSFRRTQHIFYRLPMIPRPFRWETLHFHLRQSWHTYTP